MKIGLTNLYVFRPHTEHLLYLAYLLEQADVETCFFVAEKAAAKGYPKILKQSSFIKEYVKNFLGGLRTYPVAEIYSPESLKKFIQPNVLSTEKLQSMTLSSACTLNRIESDIEREADCVKNTQDLLSVPTKNVYDAALAWIEQSQLDAVIVFNGRMELTRAVIEACKEKKIPYITHERPWFGDGIQLIPNANCLSLVETHRMVKKYSVQPLNIKQSQKAARIIAKRFLRENQFEWRVYNQSAIKVTWPIQTKREKILVLPSSRGEILGEELYLTDWEDNTVAVAALFEKLSVEPEQVVVRFHPNWSESIGKITGDKARELYKKWCEDNQYYYIDADEQADTNDLIAAADIVVLNGSSAAIEAGIMGKKIICLQESVYQHAGFVTTIVGKDSLSKFKGFEKITHEEMIRRVLRFVYTYYGRFPQFVEQVRLIDTTTYHFFSGADPQRLIDIVQTGKLTANDKTVAATMNEETPIVNQLRQAQWKNLANMINGLPHNEEIRFERYKGMRWINKLRKLFPLGDL